MLRKILRPHVLGMNHRNMHVISRHNPLPAIKLVNDKYALKQVFLKNNIPTPRTLGVYRNIIEFEKGLETLTPPFVIKPANGSAGRGIVIVKRKAEPKEAKQDETFLDVSGRRWSFEGVCLHALTILHGDYSVGRMRDAIMVEEFVEPADFLREISSKGLPDIRVIVFLGTPIVAMLRIPSEESGWRANITQGALAAGIDIDTGEVFSLYSKKEHSRQSPPPAKYSFKIPAWKKAIEIAIDAARVSGLGYCGVDLVLTKSGEIQVMECNARPGLEVQNVTGKNLLLEKERVEKEAKKLEGPGNWFGGILGRKRKGK